VLAPLWGRLVAPLASALAATSHLLIAPYRIPHHIPWAALFDGAAYLGDHLYGHPRVQVFHPMAYTRPIATIVQATPLASSPDTTLNIPTLVTGTHTITLRVRDAQGEYSNTQSIGITILPAEPPSPTTWSFLLYLDGDNAGTAAFLNRDTPLGALYRLEHATNPNVRVAALYDGPGSGDSFYYAQQPGGTFRQQPVNAATRSSPGAHSSNSR